MGREKRSFNVCDHVGIFHIFCDTRLYKYIFYDNRTLGNQNFLGVMHMARTSITILYFAHGTFNTCNGTLKSQTKPYLLPANYLDLRSHLCPLRPRRAH